MSARPFERVLVANRGEIALRVMRACRERGLATVAVHSDADATALHVRMADRAVRLGPPPPRESYLDGAKVLAAAKASGADAIHPGYGFLSENAAFAEAVAAAGLVWIGPPASAIRAMGEKTAARKRMQAAGVPVVPGVVDPIEDTGELLRIAREIGYPVMLKAAGGGGGKGIRIVHEESELVSSFERARSEAENAFKSSAVYLEKFLAKSHHIEIQVLADAHGNVVHLGERECSMQRRHQKVIEESPSPLMTPELRARMGAAACEAARAVGYRNAGTIECLVPDAPAGTSGATRPFYFLEMNTRLQVEHPVTEMVTGLDLVHLQLAIAAGERLPFTQEQVTWRGHAIEARLCAEEPEKGFVPATGTIKSLELPGGPGVRLDSALHDGLEVTVHYDSMLAKLVVHAPTRAQAIGRLLRALREVRIAGVAHNAAFLARLADSPEFRGGDYHTKSIEARLEAFLGKPERPHLEEAALVAALLHREALQRGAAERALHANGGEAASSWLLDGRRRQLERNR
ncbi:MAG: acetyl-CoA carboxylase biotin carboxylase subunit [Planctomycetes bacterium]|nr:acetyl-CoA carboxylase biotin carboxylase subunit [Planctomycetota bacterium]